MRSTANAFCMDVQIGDLRHVRSRLRALFALARTASLIVAVVLLGLAPAMAFGQVCGGMQPIGTFGGPTSRAVAVSANGVVVGNALLDGNAARAFRLDSSDVLQNLGTLGGINSSGRAVSSDGTVVVGQSTSATSSNDRVFRWTAAGGMQDIGALGNFYTLFSGMNANGSAIVGMSPNNAGQFRAFRWTVSGGMQDLGALAGHTFAWAKLVSADGSVVTGFSYPTLNTSHLFRNFRWTVAGGMQEFDTLVDARANVTAISADGDTVVGEMTYSNPSRTNAFLWTEAGGFQDIVTMGEFSSRANAVSADGGVVVGSFQTTLNQNEVFRWSVDGGMQSLGIPFGGTSASASYVSADGTTVVGEYRLNTLERRTFQWTQSRGFVDIGSLGTTETRAFAITPDGGTIVGSSRNTLNQERGFAWVGDTDGDGLLNDWECNGIPYLDASGMPQRFILDSDGDGVSDADWQHKDLFVEVDAMAGKMISNQAMEMIIQAFFDAPVTNPDGIPGIVLHLQVSDVNLVSNSPWTVVPGTNGWVSEFDPLKTAHFGTGSVEHRRAKGRAFRYAICADRIDDGSLGTAELPGNDFFITLGENPVAPTVELEAGTFMHELGHTLGLRHGGGDSINGKPNYVSVMNYALTEPLGFSQPFWTLDYSREKLATLNETSLSEPAGIPSVLYSNVIMPFGITSPLIGGRSIRYVALAGIPTDWNNDGVATSASIVQDLNYLGNGAPFASVGSPTPSQPLIGHDDWANIQLAIGTTGDFADFVHQTPPRDEVTGAFAAWRRQNLTGPGPTCDSIDFNNDTSLFDPQDIEAFLSVYSEGPCVPATATCNDIDFNNDTSLFDPCDINSFLLQFSEGPCTPCGS